MEWKTIPEFPDYSVSRGGQIRNDHTDRILALTLTRSQGGLVQVGLVRDGMQYKRGVALLVARAFLDPPTPPTFDTPINLDGDRCNNHVSNLMWRPRWFAVKYHKQFHNEKRGFDQPIRDIHTGIVYRTSWDAAITHGLIDREILVATMNRTYVWPTYQEFRLVKPQK
jgi:hypothetical protein